MAVKVDIVVSNDLVTDNRVHKVSQSLKKMGYTPRLIGRLKKKSSPLQQRDYETARMRLFFEHGPLFYLILNVRLFFKLLFSDAKIIVANDLDTLGGSYFAAKLSGKKLVYDSHEYFTQVPELINRPIKQRLWLSLEKFILPKLKNAITVSASIAEAYKRDYGTNFQVIRNLPYRVENQNPKTNTTAKQTDEKIIIYQGALNLGRGLESAIQAMRFINGAQLWLVGSGDLDEQLKILTRKLGLQFKVRFFGQVPFQEVSNLTAQADLGLSIEEDLGLNYRYALPNKLFDYIQHQVPVLVSPLPEMAKIITDYAIGQTLNSRDPHEMAMQIKEILNNQELHNKFTLSLNKAAQKLCWENETAVLEHIFGNLI